MGSIIKRGDKYRAQVRRLGHRPQCKTFGTKAAADRWVREVEGAIADGRSGGMVGELTIGDFIRAYRKLRDDARPISDSSNEHYTLKRLETLLGHLVLARATPNDLVGFAAKRRDEGAGPYTINMDVSKLGTVLRYGGAALRASPPDLVGAARPLLVHLRLIGGGGKRERRPQGDELERIVEHLRTTRGEIYAEATLFAVASAMRRGEVVGLRWSDIDDATRCAQVLRKHPRKGKALEKVPLLGPAWAIVQRQAKGELIFPAHEQTLSKYFLWACRALSIPDLHFHDLRHEAVSRIFDRTTMSVEEVMKIVGHKSHRMMMRYLSLRPTTLSDKLW
jgi:integrase